MQVKADQVIEVHDGLCTGVRQTDVGGFTGGGRGVPEGVRGGGG